jgi:hypothetical protein
MWRNGIRTIDPKDRKRLGPEKRASLLKAANYTCYYCKTLIANLKEMRLDHKNPIARGGADNEQNLAVSCIRCDFIKGTCTEAEFRARGLGRGRKTPFGSGKGSPRTMHMLKVNMRRMKPTSRTRDILNRVLRGERVDISKYAVYINPRRGSDRMPVKIRNMARNYPFLQMDGDIIWLKR